MTDFDVFIIGGGASGLMAAYQAGSRGLRVAVADGNEKLARKVRITGKGRCNLTNSCSVKEFLENVPHGGKFLFSAINRFPPEAAVSFFEGHGLKTKVERGNRVFPESDNANDVADLLARICRANNVTFIRERVKSLFKAENGLFYVKTARGEYSSSNAVIATGGMSYPLTGSDGLGYELAKKLGHSVIAPRPSLVPLNSPDGFCAELQGFSLKDIKLTAYKNDKVIFKDIGEMLFTHFGVSGPLVLSASVFMDDFAANSYRLELDLKTALDEQKLDDKIIKILAENSNKTLGNIMPSIIGKSLSPVVLRLTGVSPDIKANSLTRGDREKIVCILKKFPVKITSARPVDEAIVTSGGIDIKEINPRTMESKLIPGLYFAGEVIDVDAFTGGFNLQIAWATGYVAGNSVNVLEE